MTSSQPVVLLTPDFFALSFSIGLRRTIRSEPRQRPSRRLPCSRRDGWRRCAPLVGSASFPQPLKSVNAQQNCAEKQTHNGNGN